MQVRRIGPGEEGQAISFLREVFGVKPEERAFEPATMRWKFFAPGPDWQGSRSYVLEHDGQIAAHGCVWPVTALTGGREMRLVQVVDWAASRRVPGAGTVLLHELGMLGDGRLGIGGSGDALALKRVDRIFLRPLGTLVTYSRIVRPWRQFLSEPRKTWKSLARLARNILRWRPVPRPPAAFAAERVMRFDRPPAESFLPAGFTRLKRTPELLNHILCCPAASIAAYRIESPAEGYFVLAEVGPETRIVDLLVCSEDAGDWSAAYALATVVAMRNSQTATVASAAMMPLAREALVQVGYREAETSPVVVSKNVPELPPLHLTLLDSDILFL